MFISFTFPMWNELKSYEKIKNTIRKDYIDAKNKQLHVLQSVEFEEELVKIDHFEKSVESDTENAIKHIFRCFEENQFRPFHHKDMNDREKQHFFKIGDVISDLNWNFNPKAIDNIKVNIQEVQESVLDHSIKSLLIEYIEKLVAHFETFVEKYEKIFIHVHKHMAKCQDFLEDASPQHKCLEKACEMKEYSNEIEILNL